MSQKVTFKLDRLSKKFFIKGVGIIEPKDSDYFISEYSKTVRSIKASDYELIFDCTELVLAGKDILTGTDMTESLKDCLVLYKNDNFTNVIFNCKGNFPMAMQLNRLCKEVNLNKIQVLKY